MRDNSVTTIVKSIAILRTFGPDSSEQSASQVSKKLSMSRATAHRLLHALADGGLLEQDPSTARFRIGPQMYVLGSLYLETNDLAHAAEPVVKAVNALCGETTNLAIYQNGYAVLVMREEATHGFRWRRHIGSSVPAYASAIGLAILSQLPENEVVRVYGAESLKPVTSKATISSRTELLRRLTEIRATGVSFDRGGSEGIEGIGVAIRGRGGEVVAGIAIALPVFRINDPYRQKLAELAVKAAGLISYRLGYGAGRTGIGSVEELSDWWTRVSPESLASAPEPWQSW